MKSFFSSVGELEDDLLLYLDDIEHKTKVWLEGQSSIYDEPLYLLQTYYFFINFVVDSGILSGKHEVTLMLASKMSNDLFGIYNCLKNGCIHQASTIIRSLFETAVTTRFIFLDFDKRSELFFNYKYVEQFNKMSNDPLIIESHNQKDIRQKYHQVKSHYIPKSSWYSKVLMELIQEDRTLRNKYKKPSFKALCEIVGFKDDYEKAYGSLSLTVHGSSVVSHLFISKGIFSAAPVFNELIYTESALAINYAHKVIAPILEKHENEKALKMIEYSNWLLYAAIDLTRKT
ncbi:DUF5677 domain-containing protein [Paenibacillus sp. Soil522]|uniref:DUF5677 domain-containing protein n=1 Tax=Paenibacillus sp. Soil522 TaxID=1736388 RepID=UPI0006F5166B|nr:DUF5677 domain-containing protein [Paenibacillus sp. Soil522]KRE29648.1 hypothetical protein ASG81_25445 [Paenibacillus sp. Soil522]